MQDAIFCVIIKIRPKVLKQSLKNTLNVHAPAIKISQGSLFGPSGFHQSLLVWNVLRPVIPFYFPTSAEWSTSEPAGECATVTREFSGIFQDIRTKTEEPNTHLLLCGRESCLTIYNPQIAELQNHHKLKFTSHNFLFLKFKDICFYSKASSFHISCFLDKNALQIEIKTDIIYSRLKWC